MGCAVGWVAGRIVEEPCTADDGCGAARVDDCTAGVGACAVDGRVCAADAVCVAVSVLVYTSDSDSYGVRSMRLGPS